eukprot:CAMPEP_0183721548 /NCGR_PEP_ID=MMETSP0737-20130205/13788_1 /TAXON_ID=385413 /ORGANISM="Thalassiosira miniscula, Strain CCMP1093" /LENGTH=97 /DNA_ID=CAMNT_0025951575 /DNA_START=628 /DNA_END=922 /DNA_ORIENTATION=+
MTSRIVGQRGSPRSSRRVRAMSTAAGVCAAAGGGSALRAAAVVRGDASLRRGGEAPRSRTRGEGAQVEGGTLPISAWDAAVAAIVAAIIIAGTTTKR